MNETTNYKKYVARQLGLLNEVEFASFPKKDEYPGADKAEPKVSPTARPTPIIGVAVRGSTTGGLPSGADQRGDISPTKLGGYDRVEPQDLNSKIVDKTPKNAEIGQENVPINDNPSTTGGVTHPHQMQVTANQEPQAVTGASTDSDPTLKLKSASPKGIDVDITEKEQGGETELDTMQNKPENQMIPATSLSEGKHKAGCKCGFCANKGSFGKKKKETDEGMGEDELSDFDEPEDEKVFRKSRSNSPAGDAVRKKWKDDEAEYKKDQEKKKKDSKLNETFKRHMVLMKEYIGLNESKCPCGCEPGKCDCPPDCPKCSCNRKKKTDECATCGCGDPTDMHGMQPTDESIGEEVIRVYGPGTATSRSSGWSYLGDAASIEDGLKKYPAAEFMLINAGMPDQETVWTKKEGHKVYEEKKVGLNESYTPPFSRMRSLAGLGNTVLLTNGLMETKHAPGADNPFVTHWKMDKEKAGYVKVDEEKLKKVQSMLERKSKRGSLSETELKLAKRLEEVLKHRKQKS